MNMDTAVGMEGDHYKLRFILHFQKLCSVTYPQFLKHDSQISGIRSNIYLFSGGFLAEQIRMGHEYPSDKQKLQLSFWLACFR